MKLLTFLPHGHPQIPGKEKSYDISTLQSFQHTPSSWSLNLRVRLFGQKKERNHMEYHSKMGLEVGNQIKKERSGKPVKKDLISHILLYFSFAPVEIYKTLLKQVWLAWEQVKLGKTPLDWAFWSEGIEGKLCKFPPCSSIKLSSFSIFGNMGCFQVSLKPLLTI